MRVLFLVSEDTSVSGPLELASFLVPLDIDLHIGVYYEDRRSDYYAQGRSPADLPPAATVHRLNAHGSADLGAVYRLTKLMRTLRPDVVHVHHTLSSLIATALAKILRVPMIVRTEHNDHRRNKWHQNALNFWSMAFADRVICNSDSTMRSFHWWERVVGSHKALTIYNGIDISRISRQSVGRRAPLRRELGIPPDSFVVGSIGRLVEQKDHTTLLRGLALLDRDAIDAYCVLVGAGRLEEPLRSLADELGLSERVRFMGNLTRDDAYSYLGMFDTFVVSSIWEGFCNAAVEALAASLPLICTDIGTLREVVGPTGHYFAVGSAEQLAAALTRVARQDTFEREAAVARGRAWVADRYPIQRTAERYRELYAFGPRRPADRRYPVRWDRSAAPS